MSRYFSQKPLRKAEFIRPPNTLKAKVGSGGLGEEILNMAQSLLENNTTDFTPLCEMYLKTLEKAIAECRTSIVLREETEKREALIAAMLYPTMQIKANGGMFGYPLITVVADHLVQFLEVIEIPNDDAVELVEAFITTIRAILGGKVKGDGGKKGKDMIAALQAACTRYFERYPQNRSLFGDDY